MATAGAEAAHRQLAKMPAPSLCLPAQCFTFMLLRGGCDQSFRWQPRISLYQPVNRTKILLKGVIASIATVNLQVVASKVTARAEKIARDSRNRQIESDSARRRRGLRSDP
jgi:hypothetical protein